MSSSYVSQLQYPLSRCALKWDKISMLHSYLNTYPERHLEEGCQGHSSSALSCGAWLLQGRSLRFSPTLDVSGKDIQILFSELAGNLAGSKTLENKLNMSYLSSQILRRSCHFLKLYSDRKYNSAVCKRRMMCLSL